MTGSDRDSEAIAEMNESEREREQETGECGVGEIHAMAPLRRRTSVPTRA
jgi:hypothetical protein